MSITVKVHMDVTDDSEVTWWAESDELPGFSAVADSLAELKDLVKEGIDEFAGDYPDADASELEWILVTDTPSAPPQIVVRRGGDTGHGIGSAVRAVHSQALTPAG